MGVAAWAAETVSHLPAPGVKSTHPKAAIKAKFGRHSSGLKEALSLIDTAITTVKGQSPFSGKNLSVPSATNTLGGTKKNMEGKVDGMSDMVALCFYSAYHNQCPAI